MTTEFVLLSHGAMSEGMKQTIEMIIGKQEKLHAIGMKEEEGVGALLLQLDRILCQSDASFILMSDLFGGSVNTAVYERYQDEPRVSIVAGINLSLALELLLQADPCKQSIVSAIELAKHNIVSMADLNVMNADDE